MTKSDERERAIRTVAEKYDPSGTTMGLYHFADALGEIWDAAQAKEPHLSINVYQHDWIPGFAAYKYKGSGELKRTSRAHVVLNLGSLLAAVHTKDLPRRDLPYMIAETLMHEVIHVLEEWAGKEFSERRVEALLMKYRQKYMRAKEKS